MKKLLYLSFLLFVMISCTKSPEEKAKGLIKAHLHESLHDEKSYESVSYGKLDSVYTTALDNDQYVLAKAKCDIYNEKLQDAVKDVEMYADMYSYSYRAKYDRAREEALRYIDTLKIYAPIADSINDNFVPVFKGWSMKHSYRANNASGNKIIGHFRFYFDKDITEVIDTKDIGENAK